MYRTILITLALLACLETSPADALEKVGQYGNPEAFVFHGTKVFHPEQLRRSLLWHPDFQQALSPSAALDELLLTTEKLLLTGYLRAGFPQAQITAHKSLLQKEVVVDIKEGPRLLAGTVTIKGTRQINAAMLKHDITTPQLKDPVAGESSPGKPNSPAWHQGEPAPLDPFTIDKLNRRLENCCRDQGFFFTRLQSRVAVDIPSRTAQLVVTITNEGPPGTIQEIQIQGLKKNSREQVLQLLNVEINDPINRSSVFRMQQQLRNSARFSRFLVTPKTNQDQIQLLVKVLEFENAPPLETPLGVEATAMLRVQQWLSRFSESNQDLVFHYEPTAATATTPIPLSKAQVILSPKQGILVEATGKPSSKYAGHHTFFLAGKQLGIYNWQTRQFFLAGSWNIQPEFTLAMVPSYDETAQETSSDLRLGFGVSSIDRDGTTSPLKTNFRFTPVVFLREALKQSNQVTIVNNELRLKNTSLTLRADARTGVIKDICFLQLPGTRIEFQAGAWEHAMAAKSQAAKNFQNRYQSGQPAESLLQFVLNEILTQLEGKSNPATATARQLALNQLTSSSLKSVDRWLQYFGQHEPTAFIIPRAKPSSQGDLQRAIMAAVPIVIDPWFPRGSWPWTLGRQTGLMMAGKSRHTGQELQRLLDDESMGPVGYWAIAAFLKQFGSPKYRPFAGHALQVLNTDDFEHDARILVSQEAWTGQFIASLGNNLRKMNPETVTALTQPLPGNLQTFIREWSHQLHQSPDRPTTELFQQTLAKSWQQELSTRVAKQLQKILQPAIRTAQPGADKPAKASR